MCLLNLSFSFVSGARWSFSRRFPDQPSTWRYHLIPVDQVRIVVGVIDGGDSHAWHPHLGKLVLHTRNVEISVEEQ